MLAKLTVYCVVVTLWRKCEALVHAVNQSSQGFDHQCPILMACDLCLTVIDLHNTGLWGCAVMQDHGIIKETPDKWGEYLTCMATSHWTRREYKSKEE